MCWKSSANVRSTVMLSQEKKKRNQQQIYWIFIYLHSLKCAPETQSTESLAA